MEDLKARGPPLDVMIHKRGYQLYDGVNWGTGLEF